MSTIRQTLRHLSKTPLFKGNLWELRTTSEMDVFFPDNKLSELVLLAQNVSIPFRKIETDYRKALHQHFIMKYDDYEDIVITFIETEALDVTKFLDTWQESYLTENGEFITGIKPKHDFILAYQKINKNVIKNLLARTEGLSLGTVTNNISGFPSVLSPITGQTVSSISSLFGKELPDNMLEDVATYTLEGLMYKERESFEFSYEKVDLTLTQVTFSVDNIIVDKKETSSGFLGLF